jgi:hypothetical protein
LNPLKAVPRKMLNEQKFVVIYAHVSQLQLEGVAGVHAMRPANTECSTCKGSGQVPQHGGTLSATLL